MIWKAASVVLGLLAVATGIVAVRHLREVPPPPPPMLRAQFPVPPGVTLGSGYDALDAAIAPDERAVVFVASRDGDTALWLRVLDDGSTRRLENTDGAALPAWRADGGAIAFFAGGRLKTMTIATGEQTPVAEVQTTGGAAWQEDGSLLFGGGPGAGIRRWTTDGVSDVTRLVPGDVGHVHPFVDARGRLVYVAIRDNGARLVRLRLPGATSDEDLTETSGHAEIRHDILLHVRDNVLLAQRLNEDGTQLVGRSSSLATGLGTSDNGRATFTSSSRLVLWAQPAQRLRSLTWFDRSGTRIAEVAEPADYWQVRLSPDGRRAALTILDPLLRTLDVTAMPLDTPGNRTRISVSIGPDNEPVWAADGRTLLYRSLQAGNGAIVSRPSGVSDEPETVVLQRGQDLAPSDMRDGLLLFRTLTDGRSQVAVLDRRRNEERVITGAAFSSYGARFSPGGRWLAYVSTESGQADAYVQAWPAGTPRVRATFGGAERLEWTSDTELVFSRGDVLMQTTFTAGAEPRLSTPQALFRVPGLRDFATVAGGARFLVIGDAASGAAPEAHVILDWAPTIPPPPAPLPRL